MLYDVRDELIDNQGERNGHVGRDDDAINRGRDPFWETVGTADLVAEILQKMIKLYRLNIVASVEARVDRGDCHDASSCVAHGVAGRIFDKGNLEMKDTRDNLQAVLDAVIDLSEQ
jgi:hypothetical protein